MVHSLNSIPCDKCHMILHPQDVEAHKALHEKQGDICIVCGLGMMIHSEDEIHITCDNCSTTWTKKGHEKKLEDKI